MKLRQLVVLMFALLLIVPAAVVHAGVSISGTHRLVSVAAADEGSLLGFRLKVTNSGDSSIVAAHLSAKDPLVVPGSPGSEFDIPGLAAGDSIILDLSLRSSLPPDQLREGLQIPLNFTVTASDASGGTSSLSLESEGGTP